MLALWARSLNRLWSKNMKNHYVSKMEISHHCLCTINEIKNPGWHSQFSTVVEKYWRGNEGRRKKRNLLLLLLIMPHYTKNSDQCDPEAPATDLYLYNPTTTKKSNQERWKSLPNSFSEPNVPVMARQFRQPN